MTVKKTIYYRKKNGGKFLNFSFGWRSICFARKKYMFLVYIEEELYIRVMYAKIHSQTADETDFRVSIQIDLLLRCHNVSQASEVIEEKSSRMRWGTET